MIRTGRDGYLSCAMARLQPISPTAMVSGASSVTRPVFIVASNDLTEQICDLHARPSLCAFFA
jgi:hypothetical protein